jgi:hypothetical protein
MWIVILFFFSFFFFFPRLEKLESEELVFIM